MQVELKDHVGESLSGQPVDHGQWIVFVDGVHIGYLPKVDGAWLQSIVYMDEPTKREVMQMIGQEAHITIGGAAMPVDPDLEPEDESE